MSRRLLSLLLVLAAATPTFAVSISGIMVYSADDFGSPSGYDTFDRPENPEMHMWRTYAAGKWHALGVYDGLPPQSLTGRPRRLNANNFAVEIPLVDGENYFTLVGEPGPITATDTYDGFVVNVYFDSNLGVPGVSVLFPRYAAEDGAPTRTNRSQYIYSFDATLTQQRSPGINDTGFEIYDDGIERVSVLGASFLPEDRFLSIDLVSAQKFVASGVSDYVGSLTLLVEPSEGTGGSGAAGTGGLGASTAVPRTGVANGPRGGGSVPFIPGGSVAGTGMVSNANRGGGYAAPTSQDSDDAGGWVAGDPRADEADRDRDFDGAAATPTPKDIVGAMRQWIGAEGTSTPEAEPVVTPATVTPPAQGTPTPRATSGTRGPATASPGTSGTPTPAGSSTPASRTSSTKGLPTPTGTPASTRTAASETPSPRS